MTMLNPLQSQVSRVKDFIAEGDTLDVVNTNIYWSRGQFTLTRTGTTPNFAYTIPQGTEVKLFAYGRGNVMDVAGYPSVIATEADTNLQTGSQTIDGETVEIQGVAIQLLPQSDAYAMQFLAPEISTKISLNGGDRARLVGPLDLIGGATGLFGAGNSRALQDQNVTFAANGYPVNSNCTPVPERLIWQPAGKTDSTLVIILKVERAVTIPVIRFDADGVEPPATTTVQVRARLFSRQQSSRSMNQ